MIPKTKLTILFVCNGEQLSLTVNTKLKAWAKKYFENGKNNKDTQDTIYRLA